MVRNQLPAQVVKHACMITWSFRSNMQFYVTKNMSYTEKANENPIFNELSFSRKTAKPISFVLFNFENVLIPAYIWYGVSLPPQW